MNKTQETLLPLSRAAQAVQRARTPAEVYRTVGDEMAGLGVAYTYWLEVVDAGGGTTRYGPVAATMAPRTPHPIYLPLVAKS
ncbi:MAG: hypothetical protein KKA73_07670 [Chloroflexi bacterium]|nr:hypothetical protein [Chloroflexota bacterium]